MAVNLVQVTLGAGATQVSATSVPCKQIIIQNNAAHSCRAGDATVSATKGILMNAGPAGGSTNSGPSPVYHTNLFDWWLFGTAADVIDVLYIV